MALVVSKVVSRVFASISWRRRILAAFYVTAGENEIQDDAYVNNEIRSKSTDLFYGASQQAFPKEIIKILMAPINSDDIEIKPDGLLYLPEIKYRRILNGSFRPGGWALLPRGESLQFQNEKDKSQLITREYALFCCGRYVSQAVGEHTFYGQGNMVYGRAMEAAKSNALVRCCKDLGIASELWDPKFVMEWKEKHSKTVWCEHAFTSEKRKLWVRSDRDSEKAVSYPWKIISSGNKPN